MGVGEVELVGPLDSYETKKRVRAALPLLPLRRVMIIYEGMRGEV